MKRKGLAGFTLMEIMIVVLIIGLMAVVAAPAFARARTRTWRNTCITHLYRIAAAKEQWAMEHGQGEDATPNQAALQPYIRGTNVWTCPAGGTISINAVGTNPTCNIAGHTL